MIVTWPGCSEIDFIGTWALYGVNVAPIEAFPPSYVLTEFNIMGGKFYGIDLEDVPVPPPPRILPPEVPPVLIPQVIPETPTPEPSTGYFFAGGLAAVLAFWFSEWRKTWKR
jgi:hypothetical protein